jgi:hypothetical protein
MPHLWVKDEWYREKETSVTLSAKTDICLKSKPTDISNN